MLTVEKQNSEISWQLRNFNREQIAKIVSDNWQWSTPPPTQQTVSRTNKFIINLNLFCATTTRFLSAWIQLVSYASFSNELLLFMTQVISERDILGTQLVRRNDELALLYEKIKIQQSTLNKGEDWT